MNVTRLTGPLATFSHEAIKEPLAFGYWDGRIYADRGASRPYDSDRRLHVRDQAGNEGEVLIRVGVCSAAEPARVRIIFCGLASGNDFYRVALLAGMSSVFDQLYVGAKAGLLDTASADDLVRFNVLRAKLFSFGSHKKAFHDHCVKLCRTMVREPLFRDIH